MMLLSIMVIGNIIFHSIQKIKSEESILVELEEESESEESEFEKENTKGKESKLKMKKVLFPTDDDICHHFDFFNSFSYIKFSSYKDHQNGNTLQGFDKFVYSPPELV